MSGPLGQQVKARVEEKANVVVLGIYENGFRHVLNKVRAVSNPEDFKGLKIRVSGGKFRQNVFQQMGATPQKVAWTETFTALQTGVVDGAEAATYGFYEQKQYEAAKFLSLTSHVYTPSFLISSTAFWNSLTDEQKKVFAEVGQEITQKAYDGAAELEAKYFQDMKQFVEINDVDLNAFQDATRSSYDDYIKSQGDDWLKLVEDVK
jgi:TRAP-type C4-dicarboxylate transport system substrate-binding protein